MILLQIVAYLSVITFAGLTIARVVRYAGMPVHMRWELYPVPHEKEHPSGGSYFENVDWWTKPRKVNHLQELKFMGKELFFFQSYYRLQRKYWYAVYPFHIGTFLLLGWFVLLVTGSITSLAGIPVSAGSPVIWGGIVFYLTTITGAAGFLLATAGCTGLLVERLADENRRQYLSPVDYFTLSFSIITFLSGLCAWAFFDRGFAADTQFVTSVISFSRVGSLDPAAYISILLICLFLIYMPFTSMMHFAAKYFTFHSVRWDDTPNFIGSKLENNIQKQLNRPVSWSASHISSGKKWRENAAQTTNISDSRGK